jgi:EAL domain-containing protein (putative c-di-GMP-specific phosphodiesterase class I)/GGDEF domain-containing protein
MTFMKSDMTNNIYSIATVALSVGIFGYFLAVTIKEHNIERQQIKAIEIAELSTNIFISIDLLTKNIVETKILTASDQKLKNDIKNNIVYFATLSVGAKEPTTKALIRLDAFEGIRGDNGQDNTKDILSVSNALKGDLAFIHDISLDESKKGLNLQQKLLSKNIIWLEVLFVGAFVLIILLVRKKNKMAMDLYIKGLEQKKNAEALYEAILKERSIDPATLLHNRTSLFLRKDNYHIALLDIHHFSGISQSYGTNMAEELLLDFFLRISSCIKAESTKVYRYGIDIAAVVVPALDMKEGEFKRACEQLHACMSFYFYRSIDKSQSIPVSIYVGACSSLEGRQIGGVEIALENAKKTSLGFSIFDLADTEREKRSYKAYAKQAVLFHEAYLEEKVVVYYQPIIECQTKAIAKYEALVRLLKNDEIYHPGQFIEGVYYFGLGPKMTEIVFLKAWEATKIIDVTFNISISDIESKPLCKIMLANIVGDYERACRLTFEIIETEDESKSKKISDFISVVKGLGSKVAIDDFGTGYSNFQRLVSDWSVDIIKIDGSIVKNINKDPAAKSTVLGIVQIAKETGIRTVAEFVSDEAIFEAVKECGVDFAQGFYFGKAAPLDASV